MIALLLMMSLGCDMNPPPPKVELKPIPPKAEIVRKKRPRSGSQQDTGAEIDDNLIQDVRYEPEKPGAFDAITVIPKIDKQNGFVNIDIAWEVNGKLLISQRGNVLNNRFFSKGDTVQATVSATRRGNEASLPGALLIIGNAPPRILTNPKSLTKLDGFRVKGEDPDGGRVTYSLKDGPPGLTIGKTTGVFNFKPSKDSEGGGYKLVVVAHDEDGGESEWRMAISVSPGSESETVKKQRADRRKQWEDEQAAKKAAAEAEREGDPE
jgi:hypothetical protein